MCHKSLAAEISHLWQRQSSSCLTGENRNILPGLLLSSQWQVNQTEAALPKLLLHRSGLSWQYCKRQLPMQQLQTSPCPRRTFQRWRFQSRVYFAFILSAISVGKVALAESSECSPTHSGTEEQCKICCNTDLHTHSATAQGQPPWTCLHSKPGKQIPCHCWARSDTDKEWHTHALSEGQ